MGGFQLERVYPYLREHGEVRLVRDCKSKIDKDQFSELLAFEDLVENMCIEFNIKSQR